MFNAIFNLGSLDTWLIILLFVVGLAAIIKGGDWFVDAASWMAEVTGIPKLLVGATIVSVATTLPEMLVSIFSAVQGEVEMSIGNAVGSVTANIGLIMALSLLFMPAVIKRKDYLFKSILMLGAAGLVVICGFTKSVSVLLSVFLLIIFAAFMTDNIYHAVKSAKDDSDNEVDEKPEHDSKTIIKNIIMFIVGAAGIVLGADLLVGGGTALVDRSGNEELKRIFGVTIIAVGTSLPELVTTITAIAKKESNLSVGNIIGANVMDLTLILPLSSIISGKPLPITSPLSMYIDLPACLLVGLVALVPALIKKKFTRTQGAIMLSIYIVYLVLTCTSCFGAF